MRIQQGFSRHTALETAETTMKQQKMPLELQQTLLELQNLPLELQNPPLELQTYCKSGFSNTASPHPTIFHRISVA